MTELKTNTLYMTEKSIFPLQPSQYQDYATKAVRGYIRKRFPRFFTEQDTEDIISEVVLRMWRGHRSFDPGKGALSTWIGTIARNAVLSAAESKWHRLDVSGEFEDGEILDDCPYSTYRADEFPADGELLRDELETELFSRLRSDRDRRFLAWKILDLDASEMAEREGTSAANATLILFHMRQRLRRSA